MRTLPFYQRLALVMNGYWSLIIIGLILFGLFGTVLSIRNFNFKGEFYLKDNTLTGKGEILDIYETRFSHNESPILAYEFVFYSSVGDIKWTSYSPYRKHQIGDMVDIEYFVVNPGICRIKGMRSNPKKIWTLYMIIPLIAGVIWLLINISNGRKKIKLILNGNITDGRLTGKQKTEVQVNELDVYKMTFTYKANDGKEYKVITRTSNTDKLEDEKREKIIYDKDNPDKALIIDMLPWTVRHYIKDNWC